jgi:uncharacterized protein (TIGR02284 family)
MIDNLRMVNALNQLLTVCQESRQRCQAAADKVEQSELKAWFAICARQYAQFVATLRAEVCFHGGNPHSEVSEALASYHTQVDVAAVLRSGDASAILAACRDGEAATLATYEAVRQVGMTPELQAIVSRQHSAIQEAYEQLLVCEAQLHASPTEEPESPDLQSETQSDLSNGIYSLYLNWE